jgi:glucokinase
VLIGAVDIGGTKFAAGLVDEQGHILAQASCPSEPEKGFASGLERIEGLLRRCLAEFPGQELAGIGIGCTGPVDPVSGLLGPNNFLVGWEGENLPAALGARFGVPAAVENDADAAALAEVRWGAGQGASRLLYITVSTGIGGGLVLDGQIYRGVDGAHPEVGHQVIEPAGPACTCGASGCWEALASGPALAAWYHQQREGQAGPGQVLDARQVCQLALAGQPLALAAVEREGFYLGIGLANLVSLFTPEVIVLGGGVMESWPLFEAQVRAIIARNCRLVPYERTRLERAALGLQTGLAGAAQVWLNRV